jgi:hypothetical protein
MRVARVAKTIITIGQILFLLSGVLFARTVLPTGSILRRAISALRLFE